jgi:uncharacterized membrane protein YphA (DoxX/SURF4 family)
MQFFTRQLGIPAIFAFLAIAGQFFGGIMLMAGLAGRPAALASPIFGLAASVLSLRSFLAPRRQPNDKF